MNVNIILFDDFDVMAAKKSCCQSYFESDWSYKACERYGRTWRRLHGPDIGGGFIMDDYILEYKIS